MTELIKRREGDEPYRNRGIGSDALRALSDLYGSVLVAADNERAVHLYDRIGRDVSDAYYYIDQGFGVYEI